MGTVIYTVVYYFLGQGLVAAVIGGIFWLIALQHLYKIGWIKSLVIAVIIWIVTKASSGGSCRRSWGRCEES